MTKISLDYAHSFPGRKLEKPSFVSQKEDIITGQKPPAPPGLLIFLLLCW